MAIKPILIYGHPVLREKSLEVPEDYDVKQLVQDMRDTLANTGTGIGISANQIGVPMRAFLGPNNQAFINWEILEEKGGDERRREGCLSIPKVYAYVRRPKKIKIRYWDEDWILHEKVIKNWDARIVQHEIDHCNGVMFIDKINEMDRRKIQRALDILLSNESPELTYEVQFYMQEDPEIKAKLYG